MDAVTMDGEPLRNMRMGLIASGTLLAFSIGWAILWASSTLSHAQDPSVAIDSGTLAIDVGSLIGGTGAVGGPLLFVYALILRPGFDFGERVLASFNRALDIWERTIKKAQASEE